MHPTDERLNFGGDFHCFEDSYRTGIFSPPGEVLSEVRPSWMMYNETRPGKYHSRISFHQDPEEIHSVIPGVVVVIPAYKEELAIGKVVSLARRFAGRVIVVDDGSPDRTSIEARRAGAEVIRLSKNRGKAFALLLGLRHARDTGCSIAVTIDGDGQHRPQKIPELVQPILEGGADLVIGSRFLAENQAISSYRAVGQKTLDLFTTLATGYRSTDSQSGFRALSGRALQNLDFESSGYSIESDMIAHFSDRELAIAEIPVPANNGVPNEHKTNPVVHGISVLASILHQMASRKPLGVMGYSVSGIGLSALLLTTMAGSPFFSAAHSPETLASILVTLGILLLVTGLFLMVMGSRKRKSQAHTGELPCREFNSLREISGNDP
jgi:hypothetical protein